MYVLLISCVTVKLNSWLVFDVYNLQLLWLGYVNTQNAMTLYSYALIILMYCCLIQYVCFNYNGCQLIVEVEFLARLFEEKKSRYCCHLIVCVG